MTITKIKTITMIHNTKINIMIINIKEITTESTKITTKTKTTMVNMIMMVNTTTIKVTKA